MDRRPLQRPHVQGPDREVERRCVSVIPQDTAPTAVHPGDAAVRLEGVDRIDGKGEGAVVALRDLTVSFAVGSFTAVMGPSGSGKSTFLHVAAGLDSPTRGGRVGGVDLAVGISLITLMPKSDLLTGSPIPQAPVGLIALVFGSSAAVGFLGSQLSTRLAMRARPDDAIGLRD